MNRNLSFTPSQTNGIKFDNKMSGTGVTLTELIIVVVIIGILASLGLTGYVKTIEKSKSQEAIANLRLIRAGEKIYRVENNTYVTPAPNDYSGINNTLRLNIDDRNYNYSVPSANTIAFTARATRKPAAQSGYADTCIQINQDGTWGDGGCSGGIWPFQLPAD